MTLRNSFYFFILLIYGCTNYKVVIDKNSGAVITASPDRILPFCEKVIQDDKTVAYGFMIFFLDEEYTVGSATGMLTTSEACFEWRAKVQKIIDQGRQITIKGYGKMAEPRIVEKYTYTFNGHGTFHSNGRTIDLFSIRNELGKCFTNFQDRCTE